MCVCVQSKTALTLCPIFFPCLVDRYHRSEILATILNEYTDWERPVQHPVNLRDETLEALSDAQVVAPVVLTADVHSNTAANKTFLYVFDYQTKYGDYQQVR